MRAVRCCLGGCALPVCPTRLDLRLLNSAISRNIGNANTQPFIHAENSDKYLDFVLCSRVLNASWRYVKCGRSLIRKEQSVEFTFWGISSSIISSIKISLRSTFPTNSRSQTSTSARSRPRKTPLEARALHDGASRAARLAAAQPRRADDVAAPTKSPMSSAGHRLPAQGRRLGRRRLPPDVAKAGRPHARHPVEA